MYRSDDGGRDWTDISAGLPSRFGFPILVHPHQGDTIFAVPEQGPEMRAPTGARLAVHRSRDGGAKWKRITKGLPAQQSYAHVNRQAFAADHLDEPGLYLGTSTGQLYASFDGGDSWSLLWDLLPPIYSVEAALV